MKCILFIVFFMAGFLSVSAQTYNEWIDKSFECIESEDWTGAEKALIGALRVQPANPQNALLLSNLGTIQRKMGKNDEALKSYTNALMITPRSVTLLMNRAALFSEMEKFDDALKDYNQVLMLDDKEEDALYLRGLIRLEKNDTTACRKDFEQLLKINPKSSNARIGLAALMKLRGYYTEAIDLYTQVIRVNPEQTSLYFTGIRYGFIKIPSRNISLHIFLRTFTIDRRNADFNQNLFFCLLRNKSQQRLCRFRFHEISLN